MIRQQPEGHNTFASGDSCFCVAKVARCDTIYQYGLCELAQRQAVLVRKNKSPGRAIKSDRAKVVMTAGCISKNFDITNYIYNSKEKQLGKSEFIQLVTIHLVIAITGIK